MSQKKTLQKINNRLAPTKHSRSHTGGFKIVAALLAFLSFMAVLYLVFGESPRTSAGQVITQEQDKLALNQIIQNTDSAANSFESVMNYTWMFEDGKAVSSNAYVENSPRNQNTIYFTVTLSDINRTILYVSPNLAVGEALDSIKLDTPLSAGSYDATLTFYLLDDSEKVADTVNMVIKIVVEH